MLLKLVAIMVTLIFTDILLCIWGTVMHKIGSYLLITENIMLNSSHAGQNKLPVLYTIKTQCRLYLKCNVLYYIATI